MSGWRARFLAGTRGRIVVLLRRARHSVDDLARAVSLTDNGVRAHLATLERDGLVQQAGVRRGGGKPAQLYELTADGESLFPKAHAAVLSHLLGTLADRMPRADRERLLREVGRRLVAGVARPTGDLRSRLQAAVDVLADLGGLAEIEEGEAGFTIRGYSCPLGAVVSAHAEACSLAESALTDLLGVPVVQDCQTGERPRCAFVVGRSES